VLNIVGGDNIIKQRIGILQGRNPLILKSHGILSPVSEIADLVNYNAFSMFYFSLTPINYSSPVVC